MTFAFNVVGGGAVTQNPARAGQAGAGAAAPNSLIGGGVSAPVTASANSGPALIGVTFAFNTVSGGAVTQNPAAGQAGAGAAAPNSLIGGGVSAPVTASANSGPALIGVTFAFNTVSGGAVTQNPAAGQAGASPAATGGVSTPTAAADLSAIGDPTALLGATGGSAESTEADAAPGGSGGAPGFLGNGRRGRPGGGAFADTNEGIATGGAGSSAVIAGPGGNADTSINRGAGLAADGKGGRGSDGGFFSPGGNGRNATLGDGNNQRPGEGGAGGNGGSADDAGDLG